MIGRDLARLDNSIVSIEQFQKIFVSFFIQSKLFADSNFRYVSTHRINSQYLTHQELLDSLYDGDSCEEGSFRIKNTKRQSLSYETLLQNLTAQYDESESLLLGPKDILLLEGSTFKHSVALASVPRSGCTWFRHILSQITGTATGSLYPPNIPSDMMLLFRGNIAEGYANSKTWIIKTHYPFFTDWLPQSFNTRKIICLMRNPFSVIESYFNLMGTMLMNTSIQSTNFNVDYEKHWNDSIHYITQQIKIHLNHWLIQANEGCAVYFLRYEDLVENFQQTLLGVMQFVTGHKDLNGTLIHYRINQLQEQQKVEIYEPRKKTKLQTSHFTTEQKAYINGELNELLNIFGYTEEPSQILELNENSLNVVFDKGLEKLPEISLNRDDDGAGQQWWNLSNSLAKDIKEYVME